MSEPVTPAAVAALIDGYRGCALIYTAVQLNLPELMGTRTWTADELARQVDGVPDALYRLLRGLAAIGVCEEDADGRFALSDGGHALRADADTALREKVILAVEQYWPAWTALASCARREGTAFGQVFGVEAWEYRRTHPRLSAIFNTWLAKETALAAAEIVPAIDVGDARRVADIGGGYGALLFAMLAAHPQLTGILFDRQHVVEAHRDSRPTRPVDWVAGDFLDSVPVSADLYLLKSVIHDWDDTTAARILANCRAAMGPRSRLLLIERVLPTRARMDPAAVLLDLRMLAVTGGRERTAVALRELLEAAGFGIARVSDCRSGHLIIEAVVPC